MIALALAFVVAAVDPDLAAPSPWTIPATGDDSGVFLGAQLFTGLDASFAATAEDAVVPAFRLDRLELGGGGLWRRRLGGLVRLETIRSAAPQSAFGIDGNSLLPRLKLAYGVVRGDGDVFGVGVAVEARAGLVPDPWLETLERRLGARGLLPLPSERAGLLTASDLGATVDVAIAGGVVDVRLAVGNGEGRTELERNASKNIGAVVVFVPVVIDAFGAPIALGGQIGGRLGTLGVADVVDDRASAALFASHPRVRAGVEGTLGQGLAQRARQRPVVGGGFVDVVLLPAFIGVALRGDATTSDVAVPDSFAYRGLVAAFSDLGLDTTSAARGRARLFVGVEGVVVEGAAGPIAGVPAAANGWRAFVTLELTGLTDVVDVAAHAAALPEAG